MRDILSSLVRVISVLFLVGLVARGVFSVYCASQKVAIWAPPVSRSMVALSRSLIAARAGS
jgi:hypothetical protein